MNMSAKMEIASCLYCDGVISPIYLRCVKCWTDIIGHRYPGEAIGGEESIRLHNEAAARIRAASPDDIRAEGWTVAVHNDYRLDGETYTLGWSVKGEGRTDAEALNKVRDQIGLREVVPS